MSSSDFEQTYEWKKDGASFIIFFLFYLFIFVFSFLLFCASTIHSLKKYENIIKLQNGLWNRSERVLYRSLIITHTHTHTRLDAREGQREGCVFIRNIVSSMNRRKKNGILKTIIENNSNNNKKKNAWSRVRERVRENQVGLVRRIHYTSDSILNNTYTRGVVSFCTVIVISLPWAKRIVRWSSRLVVSKTSTRRRCRR